MRLLANENFPGVAVEALRSRGMTCSGCGRMRPASVIKRLSGGAVAEMRVLVTFDKVFGELVARSKVPSSCGIVLFRISPASPEYVATTAVHVLESGTDWAGHFSVIEETRVRMLSVP
jgi:hypothetical protein